MRNETSHSCQIIVIKVSDALVAIHLCILERVQLEFLGELEDGYAVH